MITFNKSDYDTILKYAKKNLPEEACGLIGGTIEDGDKHVKKVYLLTNIDHSNEHFSMDPKEQLAAVKDMRANGLVPLGNWHPHPESPSRPSEEDKRLAYDSKASYMILSLMNIDEPVLNSFHIEGNVSEKEDLHIQEESKMSETTANETMTMPEETVTPVQPATPAHFAPVQTSDEVSDEVSVITEGTSITGNMASTGSLDIRGNINGDVQCNGKLVVTGTINGNSNSAEFFADAAKVEGEVVSTGTVKIGLGSVIIGNITASSAVIAGAIKGDIDVQGPVVVDTSAVVMGNIKSRSVQINNGAVIEGFCSQCYADIDVESLFGENK